MNLKLTTETTEQTILRVLGEGGTQPVTLHRIVTANDGHHSPGAVSRALIGLRQAGLIDQEPGAQGRYRLTEKGMAEANVNPVPRTLNEVHAHPGGDALNVLTGELAIGTDVTGEVQRWQLWNSIGTIPFLAMGSSGSGGTGLLSGLVEATLPHYPDTRVWLIDSNHQMTEYWNRADKVAVSRLDEWERPDVLSADEMLDQVLAVQRDRARLLADAGKKAWNTPFDDLRLPLGVLVIGFLDEVIEDAGLRAKLGQVSKMARKTGILVASHVHSPGLGSFANDMALQDFFAAGNILTMRQSTKMFGRMVGPHMERFQPIPVTFDDGSTTAGLGHMADGTLIRAYWASGL